MVARSSTSQRVGSVEIIRTRARAGFPAPSRTRPFSTAPRWSRTLATTYGRMSLPPLAIAEYPLISCIGVTVIP